LESRRLFMGRYVVDGELQSAKRPVLMGKGRLLLIEVLV
jgi:hypothetical protein